MSVSRGEMWRLGCWLLAGVIVAAVSSPDSLQAKQPKPPKHIVELEIDGSSGHPFDSDDPADFAMMSRSGWTLTLHARPGLGFAGYGKPTSYPYYPMEGTTHPWLFGDPLFGPDGCPSWVEAQLAFFWDGCETDGAPDNPPWPVDETLMPFTPGVTVVEECPPFTPVEDCEDFLTIAAMKWQDATDIDALIGPYLGTVFDGYGYGSNWRFPGLVITSDSGVGVVLESEAPFDRTGEYRNLAGFIQSVSYVLSDRFYRSEVTGHMVVPDGLFTPVVHVDKAPGDACGDAGSTSDIFYKIDGMPEGDIPWCEDGGSFLFMKNIVAEKLITVRAFVVNVDADGNGPDTLWDWDFDGDCDAEDAAGLGWEVLSGEEVLRFSFYFEDLYTNTSEELDVLRWDWSGDGQVPGVVAPGGSGGVGQPPR